MALKEVKPGALGGLKRGEAWRSWGARKEVKPGAFWGALKEVKPGAFWGP